MGFFRGIGIIHGKFTGQTIEIFKRLTEGRIGSLDLIASEVKTDEPVKSPGIVVPARAPIRVIGVPARIAEVREREISVLVQRISNFYYLFEDHLDCLDQDLVHG